jgi:hypothetical protein
MSIVRSLSDWPTGLEANTKRTGGALEPDPHSVSNRMGQPQAPSPKPQAPSPEPRAPSPERGRRLAFAARRNPGRSSGTSNNPPGPLCHPPHPVWWARKPQREPRRAQESPGDPGQPPLKTSRPVRFSQPTSELPQRRSERTTRAPHRAKSRIYNPDRSYRSDRSDSSRLLWHNPRPPKEQPFPERFEETSSLIHLQSPLPSLSRCRLGGNCRPATPNVSLWLLLTRDQRSTTPAGRPHPLTPHHSRSPSFGGPPARGSLREKRFRRSIPK